MREYTFHTKWLVKAPIERVWPAIREVKQWPSWWKYVKEVTEVAPGDSNGIGNIHRFTWTSLLPYRLSFEMKLVALESRKLIEGVASGDLHGRGTWKFEDRDQETFIHYIWQVQTTKSWMNLLAPIAKPAFSWNHDSVMKEGGEGLGRLLGVEVLQR